MKGTDKRTESDLLGQKQIEDSKYWGIHTQRAIENFTITGCPVDIALIHAMALVKKACAAANSELGYLDKNISTVLIKACDEVAAGSFDDQFIVDKMQGGAGTSTNMNINEVIANRALEMSGKEKGDYGYIDPIAHVNLHQSTNDVYPTALKIAVMNKLQTLSESIAGLQGEFQNKEAEFAAILKIAKTELEDAVPMTLGLEFSAFSECLSRDRWRVFKSQERIRTVNIGATAIGTGITAARDYIFLVIEKLREFSALNIARAENLVDSTANSDVFVEISGIIKAHANNLVKIANDLRKLHMFKQIRLPAVQAGSSIMPGKVNPVIAEAVIQAGIKVMANDLIITEAASRSSLQINEFMPLLAEAILESLDILININRIFAKHISLIKADEKICRMQADNNTALITAFLPYIGYEKATALLKQYTEKEQDLSFRDFLKDSIGSDLVDKVLDHENIVSLGHDNE